MIIIKVLFIRANLGHPDSRVEKEIYSLSKYHDIELLGWDRSDDYKKVKDVDVLINDKKFTYHYIGIKAPMGEGFKKMLIPTLHFWWCVGKFLHKCNGKYDTLHICDFDTAMPAVFYLKRYKIVYDIFDYYADAHSAPAIFDRLIRKFENYIIHKSDAVILCSEARREQILPEKPEHLAIIHNSPSTGMIHEKQSLNPGSKPNRCKIVFVGMLSNDRFLKEICEAIAERDDLELHIGGMGVLSDFISSMALENENIFFYGKMDYSSVLALEQQCNIMTAIYDPRTPNHKYAAPNKFYEALMLKKPLIMMRDTGMDSYVEEYGLGEIISSGAENFKEGFSRALDNLIAKEDQWTEMGERGYKLYEEQFSWNKMENRLLDCYRLLSDTEL